jgi:AraC family transcriptional regulator of adaptative response/methylated-DNA-[protein]-cysteine methyltransferase
MTPTRYCAGGLNEEIRFAVGESSLGAILVASNTKGVAAILLGNDPELLVRDLQDRFPRAKLIGADRDYESLVARVVGLIEAPSIGLDLPLDICGTAFHQRGWRALQERPSLMQRSPAVLVRPKRSAPWQALAPPVTLLWRFPVTVSSAVMGRFRAMIGV